MSECLFDIHTDIQQKVQVIPTAYAANTPFNLAISDASCASSEKYFSPQ